jgi:multiple sugar transport system substrate-binding protein
MNAKRFFLLVLTLVMALAVIGSKPASAQGPVTLRMSTWAGVDEAAELQKILDKINASQTEYKIVHEPIPSDYTTQVKTQLAGGSGADIYWLGNEDIALASEGVFMPLTDCLKDAPAKSVGDVKDYYPGILQLTTFNNVVYGLPWIAQPVVVYYNKGMFDAAKVDYPKAGWTWDDFLKTAKALTKDTSGKGKVDQWGFTANGWPPPQMFVWQAGGDVIDTDAKSSPIDSAAAIDAWNFYLSVAYNPELAPSAEIIKEQGFDAMFKAGKVAMFMGGAADDLDRVPNLNVGVVSVPANPKTKDDSTFAWVGANMVNAATKNPALACKALLAVTDGIQNWKIVSPRISHATIDHLIASEPRKKANAEAIIAASAKMRALRLVPQMSQWNDVFWNKFMGPLLNKETDKKAADLAKDIRPQLEQFMPKSK